MTHSDRWVGPTRPGVRRWLLAGAQVAALAGIAAASGCTECAGVRPCDGSPTVSATVRFVEYATGRPVRGVRVALVRTGGVAMRPDSVEGETGDDGFVTLRADADRVDGLSVDVAVRPPAPWTPYRVRDFPLRATQGRGDGAVIGRWVVDPFVEFVGELHDLETDGRIVGARIAFVRRSGIPLRPDTLIDVSEGGGRFFFRARADAVGDAVGDLVIDGPMFNAPRVLRNVRIPVVVDDRPVQVNAVFQVPLGPAAGGQ